MIHNMQLAARMSDRTAFLNTEATEGGNRVGYLVEYDDSSVVFNHPKEQATMDDVSGRFR
ncbi:tsr1002 [Thermosynechococcus vestitus BP-1]|uniref:Tsr1002 protein n=1 Tax=Thermosynechococcus vestitus (strain NIES-2133 / IAM M-273 / BP-1) TaxID=197221 RepID=Q8DK66_THEVB|nr:tsr1002 [Thermosynechococcus vestitus BP-1]